jgi:hypothetical protein
MGRSATTKLEKIMKDRDVKKTTKIKRAETIVFPTVTYGSKSWTVRKKENWCLRAMDVEKNFTGSIDRQENERFSFGGSATQKTTGSNNP